MRTHHNVTGELDSSLALINSHKHMPGTALTEDSVSNATALGTIASTPEEFDTEKPNRDKLLGRQGASHRTKLRSLPLLTGTLRGLTPRSGG